MELTDEQELELRKEALNIALRYDVSYDALLPKAHAIFIWLKQGTSEAAECRWVVGTEIRCQYCYALVPEGWKQSHEQWHSDLDRGYEYLTDALLEGKDGE